MAKDKPLLSQKLAEHLLSTGTSASRVKLFDTIACDDKDELYKLLEDKLPLGTLKKVGKFLFGSAFEPEAAKGHVPAEDLDRLREENDNLQSQIQSLNAKAASQKRKYEATIEDLKHQLMLKDRVVEEPVEA